MTQQINPSKALVLFSGGQDSTVCLAWALERFAEVETVGFDYGQRHKVELVCRAEIRTEMNKLNPGWKARLGADHIFKVPVLGEISETALTQDAEIALGEAGLPNTFVPGRNIVFLTLAAALAYRRGLTHLVGGMCETDYSGYPDCRNDTMRSLETTINLGFDAHLTIETPLMWIDKASTWALAEELGGEAFVGLIQEWTHTCYLGYRATRHDWGYGCGTCPACELRAKGFAAYRAGKG